MWTKLGKQLRFHGIAPDGQPVHMYFWPYKANRFTVWTVGLFVGGSNRRANDWYLKGKYESRITGNGSMWALKYALARMLEFAAKLNCNEEIQVGWDDERRHKAYRYLMRHGFREDENCYFYRNPEYWNPVNPAP